MSDLDILRELIKDEALVSIEKGLYGKPKVTLIEPEEYSIDINNIPKTSIVIKVDTFPSTKKIFNNTKGECKRADFMIITNTGTRRLIIFIEMKKGKGETKKIIQQLKGAQCVVDYFRTVVNLFWGKVDFLNIRQYEYRFVSIINIGINKKAVFNSPSKGIHNKPEQMLKIISPHNLQFNRLTGGKQEQSAK